MSQSARDQGPKAEGEPSEGTGKFLIEDGSRASTVLPPAGDAEEMSLEALGALVEPEAAAPDADSGDSGPRIRVSGVITNPPPVPEIAKSVPSALLRSNRPYYPSQPASERAQLEIEDYSLRPGNPYSASSLVPPTRKPVSLAKVGVGVVVVGAVVLLGAGSFVLLGKQASGTLVATPARAAKLTPSAQRPEPSKPVVTVAENAPPTAAIAELGLPTAVAAQPAAELPPEPVRAVPVAVAPVTKPEAALPAPAIGEAPVAAAVAPVEAEPVEAALVEAAPAVAAVTPVPAAVEAAAQPVEATGPAPVASETAVAASPVPAPAPASDASAGPLPETPSREDIVAGFEKVREQLTSCAAGKHGVAKLDTTIAGSGRVTSALIDGIFKGTVEGSCMARAARAARFPAFSQATLKVTYPVSL